jgi:hypothetical protein
MTEWFGGMSRSSKRRAGWRGSGGYGARDPSCGLPAPASKGLGSAVCALSSHRLEQPRSRTVCLSAGRRRASSTEAARGDRPASLPSSMRCGLSRRCERGYTELLPDLAVWLKRSAPPVAVIAESGGRREDRQKMILEGWHNGILSGRYSGVHYHCASASVAQWISRLAKKLGLIGRTFRVEVQMTAEEIAALLPVANDPDELPSDQQLRSRDTEPPGDDQVPILAARAMLPAPAPEKLPEPAPEPYRETPEAAAKRERAYREIFGLDEPQRRRRWRR